MKLLLILFSFIYPYATQKLILAPSTSQTYNFFYRPGLKRIIFNHYQYSANIRTEINTYARGKVMKYTIQIPQKSIRITSPTTIQTSIIDYSLTENIDLSYLLPDTVLKYMQIKISNIGSVTDSIHFFVFLEYDVPEWANIRYIDKNVDFTLLKFTATKIEDTIYLNPYRGDYAFIELQHTNSDTFIVYKKYQTATWQNYFKLTKITPNPFQSKIAEYDYIITDINPFFMKPNFNIKEMIIFKIKPTPTGTKSFQASVKYLTKYKRW